MLVRSIAIYQTGATGKAKSRIVLMNGNILARTRFIGIVAVAVFMLVLVRTRRAGEWFAIRPECRRASARPAQATPAEHHADGHHRHRQPEGDKYDYEYCEHMVIVPRSGTADQV